MDKLEILQDGTLRLTRVGEESLSSSPVGVLVKDGAGYLPLSAKKEGEVYRVQYAVGEISLAVQEKAGYWKLTLTKLPADAERFVFGPYKVAGERCGEVLGAAWRTDGSVVCIQSLMPKIDGGVGDAITLQTGERIAYKKAAAQVVDGITLQCYAQDRSKDRIYSYGGRVVGYGGNAKGPIKGLEGPDGRMEGGAIALIAAQSADVLLNVIEQMEVAEGLPHPKYEGVYAKRNKRVSSAFMILSGDVLPGERLVEIAERAGLRCIYFSDLFGKWGHFTVNERAYPGGTKAIAALAARAAKEKISIGTHNLSNFITTNDPYVTPVPHDGLLVMDETELTQNVGVDDTTLWIADENNYNEPRPLNTVRIGDELITFERFDKEKKCLLGCMRGAYGTTATAHKAGDGVKRLWDHGYKTLFPSAALQGEMADHLADSLLACGITRTSFDGLEGCQYPGHGNYGTAEFVRRVLERCGENMICDASMTSNYLWHALAYCNWGEPWYDSERRGGSYGLRKNNQPFFKNNLIHPMMGWYKVNDAKGKFEATTPEQMEFMLSRMAAFDAGIALTMNSRVIRNHGLMDEYLELVKLWEEFRFEADIPASVLEKMREEYVDWHLEKEEDGWRLTQLVLHRQDLDYGDQNVATEAGMIYQSGRTDEENGWKYHSSVFDAGNAEMGLDDPLRFRLRVGHHGHGKMKDLSFGGLHFYFIANGGDYLIYDGGVTLKHCDENFNLLEVLQGGDPSRVSAPKRMERNMLLLDLCYATDRDEVARYELTDICKRAEYRIERKRK